MKRILAGLVVLFGMTIPAPAALLIKDNPGGIVQEFLELRDKADKDGELVIIQGLCLSSCTVFLSAKLYCVDRNSVLGFHAAYYERPGDYAKETTQMLLSLYPPKVRDWINKHGGMGADLILLHGEDMRAAVNVCGSIK